MARGLRRNSHLAPTPRRKLLWLKPAPRAVDFAAALEYARSVGGPALRSMTFTDRAELLQALYDVLFASREELIELSISNGGQHPQ